MNNLQHTTGITESRAMDLIFDACRSNTNRNDWKNAEGFTVKFTKVAGAWAAVLRDKFGGFAASAKVDEFDV